MTFGIDPIYFLWKMARHPHSASRQGLKPLFFRPLDVTAEAATHKDRVKPPLETRRDTRQRVDAVRTPFHRV
jgi:hypothetical protein